MPHDIIGWIHTIAALIALFTGSVILIKTKGTALHKKIGRIYGISMLIVCATAFMIYRVHNTFGILHFFATVSTVTLILGMLPMYIKGYKNPIVAHLSWMYWSVIGLYCAFAAEIFTRLPIILNIDNSYVIFYVLVFLSAGLIGIIGSRYFKKKKKIWEEQFSV
jgi:uncharacterized membrane protein